MFDIGFTELLLCLVVALVVIGPEQLPGTVRTVALWIGRLKRSLAETRTEIERQIGADEIRRQLHNEEIMERIEETRLQLEASLRDYGVYEHDGNTTTENTADQTRTAADYGPPEELPDHSHGAQASDSVKAQNNSNAPAASTAAANLPAPGQAHPSAATSTAPTSSPTASSAAPSTAAKAESHNQPLQGQATSAAVIPVKDPSQ